MKVLLWAAVGLMLFGAAMLVADVAAASGLWIAMVAVGVAIVAAAVWRHPHTAGGAK